MTYTNSFHHGTERVPGHNRRTLQGEAHIDPNGKHEIWKDEKLADAYDRIFGEALQEYNAKQKRADRKIKSYLQNVRQNSKLNDCYEFIAQVGNEKSHPEEQLCHDILKAYYDGFSARNPGLEVVGGYYHADEIGGCPHIHVDYVPTAQNKKTGLKLKNNLSEALKSLGYETEYVEDKVRGINKKTGKPYTKMVSAEMKFQEAEREALTEICRQFGVEIENPKRSKDEYCTSKQLRQARDIRIQNNTKSLELSNRERKVQKREAEALEQKKTWESSKIESEKFVSSLANELKYLKYLPKIENMTDIGSAEKLEQKIPVEKKGTFGKETHYEYGYRIAKSIWNFVEERYNALKDKCSKLYKIIKDLKRENELQKARINTLERDNSRLSSEVDKIVEERLKTRSEALVERGRAEFKGKYDELYGSVYSDRVTFESENGIKCTAKNGLFKYAQRVTDKLDKFKNMTPQQFREWYNNEHYQGMERE